MTWKTADAPLMRRTEAADMRGEDGRTVRGAGREGRTARWTSFESVHLRPYQPTGSAGSGESAAANALRGAAAAGPVAPHSLLRGTPRRHRNSSESWPPPELPPRVKGVPLADDAAYVQHQESRP